jgi:hypothetical protein
MGRPLRSKPRGGAYEGVSLLHLPRIAQPSVKSAPSIDGPAAVAPALSAPPPGPHPRGVPLTALGQAGGPGSLLSSPPLSSLGSARTSSGRANRSGQDPHGRGDRRRRHARQKGAERAAQSVLEERGSSDVPRETLSGWPVVGNGSGAGRGTGVAEILPRGPPGRW